MTWNARDYGVEESALRRGLHPLIAGETPAEEPQGPQQETPEQQLLRLLSDPMAPPVSFRPLRPSTMLRLEMAQAGLVPEGDWARIRRLMTRGILEQ